MCAGRIIADSDDEGDFSPVPSPVRINVSSSGGGSVPGSSDPGFFRSEYLAQREAAIYDHGPTGEVPSDRSPNEEEESAVQGGDGADTHDPWVILSSPDSLRGSPKAKSLTRPRVSKTYSKKAGFSSSAASPKDAAYIGTPKANNATPLRVSRTDSKKNPGMDSSATSRHEVIDLVSRDQRSTTRPTSKAVKRNVNKADSEHGGTSPGPAKKKKKRISELRVGDSGSLEEGSGDIPSSLNTRDSTSMAPPTRRSAHDGPDGDSGQLYVEPSRMTASQKGQYEEVGIPLLSSLDEPPNLKQYTHLARSSGSATIAYPTPTQYRRPYPPSIPPLPQDLSPAESRRGSRRRRLSSLPPIGDNNPSSSPDVILGAPDKNEIQPGVDAEPPIVEQDNSCDEDWNEVDHGFPHPQERQPNRTKKRQRATKQESTEIRDDITATADCIDDEAQANVDRQPEPKKRGRKKKNKGKVPDPEPVAPAAKKTQPPEDVPPQKRKRGRPRKSDKVGLPGNVPAKDPELPEVDHGDHGLEASRDVEDGSEETGSRDTNAKERNEQDSKEDAEVGAKKDDDRDAGVSPRRSVAADTGQGAVESPAAAPANDSTGQGDAADGKVEPVTKAQAGTPGKAGGLPGPGAKPVYRVGLSKRSRITPLLKCIRKS